MNIESGQLSIISYIPGGIGLILSAFLVSLQWALLNLSANDKRLFLDTGELYSDVL